MFLFTIGSAQEVFEEAQRKFRIFDQADLDQHIYAARTIADTWIDALRIITGCQQKCSRRVVGRGNAIQRVEHHLEFVDIGNKHLEILDQDKCRQFALRRILQRIRKLLPGAGTATPRWRTHVEYHAALFRMTRTLGLEQSCLASTWRADQNYLAQTRHV